MKQHHRRISLVWGIMLSLTVLVGGCRSVRGAGEGTGARTFAPPLSTSPDSVAHAGGAHFAAAPAQLTGAYMTPPAPTESPFVPAAPQSVTVSPAVPPAMLPGTSGWTPSPNALQQVSTASSSPLPETACLPSDAEWRRQMEERTAALLQRLTQVEGELNTTRAMLQTVNQSLQASQGRIEQLNQEVTRWKGEFQRLEGEMKAQQIADLKSLDELTASMHQVLLRQRGQTSPAEGAK